MILISSSVTRLGDFWKVLATNFLTKIAQIIGDFCATYFEIQNFYVKTAVTNFEKFGLLFIPSGNTD